MEAAVGAAGATLAAAPLTVEALAGATVATAAFGGALRLAAVRTDLVVDFDAVEASLLVGAKGSSVAAGVSVAAVGSAGVSVVIGARVAIAGVVVSGVTVTGAGASCAARGVEESAKTAAIAAAPARA